MKSVPDMLFLTIGLNFEGCCSLQKLILHNLLKNKCSVAIENIISNIFNFVEYGVLLLSQTPIDEISLEP